MSASPSNSHVKMLVHLEQDEDGYPPTTEESLWVLPMGEGLFQVDNIPFFAWELALGDVVTAEPEEGMWRFRKVVRRSGHATLRLIIYDVAEVRRSFPDFEIVRAHKEFMHAPPLKVGFLPMEQLLGWHLWVHMRPRKT